MKARVDGSEIEFGLLQIADMNYGQLQRWKDFVRLKYELNIEIEIFKAKLNDHFSNFRRDEIEEDDTDGFQELQDYKDAGRPKLSVLMSQHPELLDSVTRFCSYEVIHLLVAHPKPRSSYYYSVNTLDSVKIIGGTVRLSGICFKSDYIEHTYNHELPRRHALLKRSS